MKRLGGHDERSYAHQGLRFTPALATARLFFAQ